MPDESTADELTGELLARTSPSLIDPGIAMAAGLAGGDVLSHEFVPDAYANTSTRAWRNRSPMPRSSASRASDLMAPSVGTGTFWTGHRRLRLGTQLPTVLTDIDAGYELVVDGG